MRRLERAVVTVVEYLAALMLAGAVAVLVLLAIEFLREVTS